MTGHVNELYLVNGRITMPLFREKKIVNVHIFHSQNFAFSQLHYGYEMRLWGLQLSV